MQQAARRMDDRGRLRDRLHHAGLVVGEHERDERPYRVGDGSRERGQVDPPLGIDGNFPDHLAREAAAGADRGMLDRGDKRISRGRFSLAVSMAGDRASMFASVPPEVKNTSAGRADTSTATCSRAASTSRRAARPSACTEDGLPATARASTKARRASGRNGAVAFQSR